MFLVDGFEAGERDDVGGGAPVGVEALRGLFDAVVGGGDFAVQLLVDFLQFPRLAALVLQPFEVGNDDAAGVAEDVGDDVDAALAQDLVAVGIGGTVGPLGDELDF